MLKGYIKVDKSITYILKGNGIVGNVNENNDIVGHINENTTFIGRVDKSGDITGKIEKPSSQTPVIDGDHQFVVVDLVKMHEQITSIGNANAVVPFTVQTSQQVLSKTIEIYAVPTAVSVSQVTVNNITFTSSTVTVNQVTVTINEEES